MEIEKEFEEDEGIIQDLVFDKIFPILQSIDEDYPDHSAFFTMFISAMHVVFSEGWTKEALLRAVEDHHTIFLEIEAEMPPTIGMH